jgi:hypothetical protein
MMITARTVGVRRQALEPEPGLGERDHFVLIHHTLLALGRRGLKGTPLPSLSISGGSHTPKLDGTRWWFVVADGATVAEVEAGISGTRGVPPGMTEAALERLLEERACRFPVETRLRDLLEASPLRGQRQLARSGDEVPTGLPLRR